MSRVDLASGPLRFADDPNERPLLGFPSRVYADKWAHVLRRDPCSYCGRRSDDMTVDHVHAFARSKVPSRKTRISSNGAGACSTCNQQKGAEKLLHYIADNPVGRRMPRIAWKDTAMPGKLFGRLKARKPSAPWWSKLFAELLKQPSTRRADASQVWWVQLEVDGRPRVLKIRALDDGDVVTVLHARWETRP